MVTNLRPVCTYMAYIWLSWLLHVRNFNVISIVKIRKNLLRWTSLIDKYTDTHAPCT